MTAIAFFAGPIGRWIVIAALVAAFGAACLGKGVLIEEHRRDAQDAIRDAAAMKTQVAAVTAARAEEHRKTDAVQGVANEIRKQLDTAAAAAPATRAAGERLRDQLTAACTGARSPAQPTAASASAPADPAASVLADVQRRLEEAEGATIEFADASRIAGLGCERSFDALNPPKE